MLRRGISGMISSRRLVMTAFDYTVSTDKSFDRDVEAT